MANENIFHLAGKTYKVYPLNAPWGPVRIVLTEESYLDGTLAVLAYEVSGECPEEFAVLTVNLGSPIQDKKKAFFDINNCGYLFCQLCEEGIIQTIPISVSSGFCTYPLCEWDKNKFVPEGIN